MSMSSPDNPTSTTIEDKSLDTEDAIQFLGEDDEQEVIELEDKKAAKQDKESEGESDKSSEGKEEDKDSLEDELEEELSEPDDEKLELIELPRRREILGKYPNLFKDFPQLEKSMYREQKYSELLPTIEDAKAAVEKVQRLDQYEKEIMGGSTESLLSTVKDNDKEAFAKVVDNYLPTLYKVDQNAYYHTLGNIVKHTIISMVRDSKEQDDDDLASAAAVLNKYMFGTNQFTHPQRLSKDEVSAEKKEKENEISEREKALVEKQYNAAVESVSTKVDNTIKATIDKFIDPNNSMTEFVKKNATREVLEGLEDLISKDTRFLAIYDRLWERALANDFNKESMDRIESAYKSKAKTLLPLLIKKARNEALKGINRKVDDKDRKGPLPVGRTRSSTSLASGKTNESASKQIPRGMSTLEFLNSD